MIVFAVKTVVVAVDSVMHERKMIPHLFSLFIIPAPCIVFVILYYRTDAGGGKP